LHIAEQSAWGAALLAGEAIGWWRASEQAQRSLVLGDEVMPRRYAVAMYRELLPIFLDASRVNQTLSHALNDWYWRTSEYAK
jgi:glycerol kinase